MPAPIAKGVIIVAAVLIAAGYAVYDHREFLKEYLNRSRQKVAHAVNQFTDEFMPSEEERERRRQQQQHQRETEMTDHDRRNQSGETLNEKKDFNEKAETTAREGEWPSDSMFRHRTVHRRPSLDDGEAVKNPFADENKVPYEVNDKNILAPSDSSDTLSATSDKDMLDMPGALKDSTHFNKDDTPQPAPPAALSSEAQPPPPIVQHQHDEPQQPLAQHTPPQPYWSIHEWQQNVSGNDDEQSERESDLDLVSAHSAMPSEDELDRVEVASDIASSMDGSWSEVSEQSGAEYP